MRKLIGILVFCSVVAGVVSFVVTNPEVQRRIEDEKRAKQEATAAKQKDWEDGWKKWIEESKKKTDERVKQANEPGFDDGFRIGFMGGKLTRAQTNVAVPSARVEAMAMEQIEKQNTPADDHAAFIRGFTAGWDFGWTSK